MDLQKLNMTLADLPFPAIRYFEQIDSTSDEAIRWVQAGAPDLALVVANEQTHGRGRAGRPWYTPPDATLAFSLVLRIPAQDSAPQPFPLYRLSGLGALAVCAAFQKNYGVPSQIKWPNDVLIAQRKVAGILVELEWQGDNLSAIILGIGINITRQAIPSSSSLQFPATFLEAYLAIPVIRLELLRTVLVEITTWRARLFSDEFLQAWEDRLAWRGDWVQVLRTTNQNDPNQTTLVVEGQVLGLEADGSLRLRDTTGQLHLVRSGEIRLRPVHLP